MVPFLYQTSPCPFNEEVDFFDFLSGYQVQVKNEKMEIEVLTLQTVIGDTGMSRYEDFYMVQSLSMTVRK